MIKNLDTQGHLPQGMQNLVLKTTYNHTNRPEILTMKRANNRI